MATSSNHNIYFDNAASTPVADEVISEMLPYLKNQYGNPSSIHAFGRETTRAIQLARKRVAGLVNASSPREITFTSGGTEADNLALKGAAFRAKNSGKGTRIITSSIEHDAILEPCRDLQRMGFQVTYLPVDAEGMVRPSDLSGAITPDVALVSIMYANNEVGTIQPVKELAAIAHESGALFHTDAVQAAGKIPIDVKQMGMDMMSISSHKINGPKGVGALYVKSGIKLEPLLHGGGQESTLRSGTENVPGIAGFGRACQLAGERMQAYGQRVGEMRD
ncbi:MAG TPA: cysteine desulfurase family protein, partial [Nitrososphaera sp.]|nr:cysteine desulfurase family protein [Nitrososphaera sp.]